MGNKMKALILGLGVLFHTLSYGGVDYSLVVSDDKTVQVDRQTVTAQSGAYGLAAVNTRYSTATQQYSSNGLLLSIDQRRNKMSYNGQIGVGNKDGNNYMLGNMAVNYRLDHYSRLGVEVFGDLVDSPRSLASNINYRGVVYSIDLDAGGYGMVGGVRHMFFSDSNIQRGIYGKTWLNLAPGINGYLTAREHTNSSPSVYYSSPPTYTRSGAGLSGSTVIGGVRVGGFIEHSVIRTTYHSEHTNTWQLRLNGALSDKTRLILKAGRDYSVSSDFDYRYITVQLMAAW